MGLPLNTIQSDITKIFADPVISAKPDKVKLVLRSILENNDREDALDTYKLAIESDLRPEEVTAILEHVSGYLRVNRLEVQDLDILQGKISDLLAAIDGVE